MNDFEMFNAHEDRIPALIGRVRMNNLSLIVIPSNCYSSIAQFASPYQFSVSQLIESVKECHARHFPWPMRSEQTIEHLQLQQIITQKFYSTRIKFVFN